MKENEDGNESDFSSPTVVTRSPSKTTVKPNISQIHIWVNGNINNTPPHKNNTGGDSDSSDSSISDSSESDSSESESSGSDSRSSTAAPSTTMPTTLMPDTTSTTDG